MEIRKLTPEELDLTPENYYETGDEDDLVVNSSSLQDIDPNDGGSIKKFEAAMRDKKEKKDSVSLERGRLIHLFAKKPSDFAVEPEDKPSKNIVDIIDIVHNRAKNQGTVASDLAVYSDVIVEAASIVDYGQTWGSATIIKKVLEKRYYFDFLLENSGKLMLTTGDKRSVMGMIETIESSVTQREFLLDKKEVDNADEFFKKEFVIAFSINGIKCKAMLDNIYINHKTKTITLRDIKSTSKPVSRYMGHREYVEDLTDNSIKPVIVNGAFQYFKTYRQIAFYDIALQAFLGESYGLYKVNRIIDAIESDGLFEMISYPISPKWNWIGRSEVEFCMDKIKEYIDYRGINTF